MLLCFYERIVGELCLE